MKDLYLQVLNSEISLDEFAEKIKRLQETAFGMGYNEAMIDTNSYTESK